MPKQNTTDEKQVILRLQGQIALAKRQSKSWKLEAVTRGKEIEKLFRIVKDCPGQMSPEVWTNLMEVLEVYRERCGDIDYYRSKQKKSRLSHDLPVRA